MDIQTQVAVIVVLAVVLPLAAGPLAAVVVEIEQRRQKNNLATNRKCRNKMERQSE